jgi:hypothetical protein
MTKGRDLQLPGLQKKISSRPSPSPGRFAKERKREGEKTRLGSLWPNFNFKFEFVCKGFENLPKVVSRGFKHNQKIMANV